MERLIVRKAEKGNEWHELLNPLTAVQFFTTRRVQPFDKGSRIKSRTMAHIQKSFFYDGALQINIDRINHLRTLGLPFMGRSVLETGCGGCGDFTRYLLDSGARVTLNDVREENIKNLLETKGLDLEYNTWNLNLPIPDEKKFDIVFSYGTLYHLRHPDVAIKSFADACKEFTIISTITSGKNDTEINHLAEWNGNEMAFDGTGCRPGRMFVYNELKKHFKNVYMLKTQPNNSDYPLHFPCNGGRNIFIGSHIDLVNPNLITDFPNDYTH